MAPVIVNEEYGTEDVRVTLEWNQDESMIFNVTAAPNVPVLFSGLSVAKLNVSYNTLYNLSITPRCGLGTATIVKLHYGK